MATPATALEKLVQEINELTERLAAAEASGVSTQKAKAIRETVQLASDRLRKVIEELDPIRQPSFVFDLSKPDVLARVVGITMIAQPRKPLESVIADRFYGSGVYAIYYVGDFPAYAEISRREHPIYVGKADPAEHSAKTPEKQGDRLSNRLKDHRKNIRKAATTLRLEDFEYRALVVQSGWQVWAESYLINLFKPIWNNEMNICYGIGKHGDSPTTRANLRSPWDTLHPGRDWAHRAPGMKDARSAQRIEADIRRHLAANPPFESIDEILRRFLEEMRTLS